MIAACQNKNLDAIIPSLKLAAAVHQTRRSAGRETKAQVTLIPFSPREDTSPTNGPNSADSTDIEYCRTSNDVRQLSLKDPGSHRKAK